MKPSAILLPRSAVAALAAQLAWRAAPAVLLAGAMAIVLHGAVTGHRVRAASPSLPGAMAAWRAPFHAPHISTLSQPLLPDGRAARAPHPDA